MNPTRITTHPRFKLTHITLEDVTTRLKKLNPNKASDIFNIKPAIMKDLTPFIAPILTKLFNKAIDKHEYPDAHKLTKVIELHKKKEESLPTNYRPISLLPIIAKLLDTIINTQIMTHLLKYNILSHTQYAFRPHSSTTTALQTVINDIHNKRTKKQPTLAIYIDLSKAYDTIEHDKLLDKLQHDFNFSPETVAFFRSYLHNRTQSTHTTHAKSRPQLITHGIPQGSTLSTTFFLLYINDIMKAIKQSKVYTYADDTTLIITAKTARKLQELAQTELTSLIKYFHSNNLVPNPTKTVFSTFYPRTPLDITLKIDKVTLDKKTQAPLLGMTIQNTLKYHQTITNIMKKLQPIIRNFKYLNKILSTEYMLALYYTHAYPLLIGNITVWGTSDEKKSYIQPLIRTQKKLIRLIANATPLTHTRPLMNKYKILNLTDIYIHRVCAEMHPFIYECNTANRPEHSHHYIPVTHIHDYPTRYAKQQHQYIPNPYNYSKTKQPSHKLNHFSEQYSRVWNSVPSAIKQIHGNARFKNTLKQHLLQQKLKS